jgi:tRNA G18 (ribose-2'-O)-methylase SpoU
MRKKLNSELDRINPNDYKSVKKTPLVVVLDNVRSLNNIGSVFRTADGFRVEAIYLCGITAQPPHRDIHKTALGATESVPWKYFSTTKDALVELRAKEYKILAIEQVENSILLDELVLETKESYALIFGHEVRGVDQEIVDLCDACIEIPQMGTKHSFNISVSAGIVLWEFYKLLKSL